MLRSQAINYFIDRFGFEKYLEIGVEAGVTFNAVVAARKVAVDPNFKISKSDLLGVAYEMTSDDYMDNNPNEKFDMIFIDGLHSFEQSLCDFTRTLLRLNEGGIILIDDCVPSDCVSAVRDQSVCVKVKKAENFEDMNWMGDVYKTVLFINDYFDQLSFAVISGTMGIVAVWYQPRPIKKLFSSITEISACDYFKYKYEILPTLPILSLEEIGTRIPFVQTLEESQSR